jgi:hypothetical protein
MSDNDTYSNDLMTDFKRIMRHPDCHEDVTVMGESQPCGNMAVAMRLDPESGRPYPVCSYHARSPMVPLMAL